VKSKRSNLAGKVGFLTVVTAIFIIIEYNVTSSITSPAFSLNNSSATTSSNAWTIGANLPTPRSEFAGTSINEKIYIIGGFNNKGKTSDTVEFYDTKTNVWSSASPLPIPLDHTAAAAYNGSIYVVGGYTSSQIPASNPSIRLFIYSPLADKWTEGKSLPKSRGALTANFVDGILYAIGGVDKSGVSNSNTAYDPDTDTWTTKKPMPTAREHAASALVGGKLYVVGGRVVNLEHNLNTNEVYNPSNDSWTKLEPMPSNRSGLSAAASSSGDIYVFGGEENAGTFNNNEKYDPDTDKWELKSPMPTARHGLAAVTVSDKIYVIGGGPEPGLIVGGVNEIYQPGNNTTP